MDEKKRQIYFNRTIYTGRRLELTSSLKEPEASFSDSERYRSIRVKTFPNLKISCVNYKKIGFIVTPKNIYRVIKFFNEIISWFYDKDKSDLFLLNNDNRLIFNGDYKQLSAVYKKGNYETSTMKAIPNVVQLSTLEECAEGITLFFNSTDTYVSIPLDEVEDIFGILRDFSFTEEALLLLTTADYLDSKSKITKYDPMNINSETWSL